MNTISVEILIILFLVFSNGLFSMSEMAVILARKVRLQQRIDKGDKGAQAALELVNAPGQFLSTIQIGITLVGVLAGAFGGATIAEQLALVLNRISWMAPYSESIGVGIVVLGIAYLTLVIGELVPKQLALYDAEKIASNVAPLMLSILRIATPFVYILNISTEAVLKILGKEMSLEPSITEEDIKLLMKQGAKVGVFDPTEPEMVERVFRLGVRRISTIMTPRTEVTWFDTQDTIEDINHKIMESGHSCYPVAEGDLDNTLGVVLTKDLLVQSFNGQPLDLKIVLHPGLFVPESTPISEALAQFKETGLQIALVIDEFGGFQGVVTMNDILEAIVGYMPTTDTSAEAEITQRDDGSWLIDGMVLIDEFKELIGIEALPNEEQGGFQTMGGFAMTFLGRIPLTGDTLEWGGFRFEIVDMDGRRVDKLLVIPIA